MDIAGASIVTGRGTLNLGARWAEKSWYRRARRRAICMPRWSSRNCGASGPDAEFFGCTGPRLRAAGVRTVVDAASLAVVGLLEVVAHIPRIYGEYRKLLAAARDRQAGSGHPHRFPGFSPARGPQAARRRDSGGLPGGAPGLGLAQGTGPRNAPHHPPPALHLSLRRGVFHRAKGFRPPISATRWPGWSRPSLSRDEFFRKHRLAAERPLVTVLPGSRRGEAARHLPALLDAVDRLYREQAVNFVLPASAHHRGRVFPGADRAARRFG